MTAEASAPVTPTLTPERPSPTDLLQSSIKRLGVLPTIPEAAMRALTVANDGQASLCDLAVVIERDPVLATGVLKLANSALFRAGRELASLEQAVVRLGLRSVKQLILAVGVRSLLRSGSMATQRHRERLWEHSFLTACLCRRLNQTLACGYQGEEFAAGLAHDLGRVLILMVQPTSVGDDTEDEFLEGPDVLEREHQAVGTDHCSLGAWYAQHNWLPGMVVKAIEFHHAPERARPFQHLVALVATAEHLVNHFARDQRTKGYDVATNPGWGLLVEGMDMEARERLEYLLPDLLDEAAEEVRADAFQGV
jgi:HD-like signal output (HDOD) protein